MRRALVFVTLALSLGGLLAVTGYLTLDRVLARRLGHAVTAACGDCTLSLGRLYTTDFTVVIEHLTFMHGTPDLHRRFRVVIDQVRVRPDWLALLRGRVRLNEVRVLGPQITMIDHAEGREPGAGERRQELPAFEVDDLTLDEGTLTYVRDRADTHAVVSFRKLKGEARAFGTTPARRDLAVRGRLSAQLGRAGELRLAVSARPTAPVTDLDVELWVNDQDVKEFGAFFEPNAGVKVSGALQFAHATSTLRGPRLVTRVRAVFEDFDVEVERHGTRGEWAAFFTNLGLALGVKQSNVSLSEREQTRELTLGRRSRESLVPFLLRGLKETVFSVAKTPTARALTE